MTAQADKRPIAIRAVIPFVFRQWLLQPYRAAFVLVGFLGATAADLFMPIYSGHLVDALTSGPYHNAARHAALAAFGGIVALGLVSMILRLIGLHAIVPFTLKTMSDVAREAFMRVQRFSTDWHTNSFAGSSVRKITRGALYWRSAAAIHLPRRRRRPQERGGHLKEVPRALAKANRRSQSGRKRGSMCLIETLPKRLPQAISIASLRYPTTIVTSSTPTRSRLCSALCRMGVPWTWIRGFGVRSVSGRRREPTPMARMSACLGEFKGISSLFSSRISPLKHPECLRSLLPRPCRTTLLLERERKIGRRPLCWNPSELALAV